MRLASIVLVFLWSAAFAEAAPKVAFPYDATVEAEETYARCGPGSTYYPTSKLRKGERVTVKRHDPGGWHMIVPPPGSFSWVPAKYVDKTTAGHGTINTNGVAAQVGSFESDIRELFHRRLSRGDEVEILGEKQLPPLTQAGPLELWYRIAPVAGEWRWVSGQALSPAPRDGEAPIRAEPFDPVAPPQSRSRSGPPVPVADDDLDFEEPLPIAGGRPSPSGNSNSANSNTGTSKPSSGTLPGSDGQAIKERPLVRREGKPSDIPPLPERGTKKRMDAHLEELDRLDARFRAILDKEPLEWDFTDLEKDYRRLHDEVDTANLQQMVETRLTRLADYRTVRGEHEAAAAAAAAVGRRDAELAEIQRKQEARLAGMRQPRFDGAGILQRSALNRAGAPRYVLITPAGKVLAYVVPAAGLNLEPWVGRAVGLNGSRVAHPDLKADLITVLRLTPVKLAP